MNRVNRKPYPWTCGHCRQQAVYDGVADYETTLDYDSRTYHIKIANLKAPRCRNCGTVLIDGDASEKITARFLRQARILTARRIRQYRERLGISQGDLAKAVGIAEETMARLEKGGQFPNRSQDNLLRLFFGSPEAREMLTKQRLSKVGLVIGKRTKVSA